VQLNGLALRLDRLEGVEGGRAVPDYAAEKHDDEERNPPDQQLDPPGIDPVGPILRSGVRGTKPPRKSERGDDRGQHDRQHDRQRVVDDLEVCRANRSLRLQDASGTTGERQQQHRRYRYTVRLYLSEQPNRTGVAGRDAVEVVVLQNSPTTIFARPLAEQNVLSVFKQAACAARSERTFCDTGKTLIASRHISQPIRLVPERSTPST